MRTENRSAPRQAVSRLAVGCVVLFALSGGAEAQRQGRQVVDTYCSPCHATGKDNAPTIGDAKAWSTRAAQGLTALTAHAISGIRNMPPHGGNPGLSDIEIARAITYMVNESGGRWIEPAAIRVVARGGESIVQGQCAKCHLDGTDGAPRIGDRQAWIPRLQRGLDRLVASAVHGHGPMPARGGMPDLSDEEIRSAIVYMFNHGLPPVPPVAAATEPVSARHKVISGTDIYFGVMHADKIRAAAKADKADRRSAVVPEGKDYYHLNISLADNASKAPVTDAQVNVRVSDGMYTESKSLGLVAANNAVSYGNYFRFSSGNAYSITAEIRRPGVAGTFEARFDFRAP